MSAGVRAPDYVRAVVERDQSRSVVMTTGGVVASEHPLASQAAVGVLAAGGHAVDAAIAANAVMGVVAPMMCGVGGDLFAVVYDAAADRVHGLNGSGYAPAATSIDALRRLGFSDMPQSGIHAVTVPGAVSAWAHLSERFGRLGLARVLAPASALAREGVPVAEITAEEWAGSPALGSGDAEARRVFLPAGRPPATGDVFSNPDLAATYDAIGAHGAEAFYQGPIARRILDCARRYGGALAEADLADYEAEWVEPLSTAYREWTVYELPPNGQGIAALMMLNIMEQWPLGTFGQNSAAALHVLIEAKKLAYADLAAYVCDPARHPVPVDDMLAKSYAASRAASIDPARAQASVAPGGFPTEGGDTTYLSVVDRAGNMVSLIQSNFANFGSGLVPEGGGFALQSRGGLFTLDASHPNALAPRKRPLHTIIPGFMARGDVRVAFGIMGGWNQAQAHAQFVSNVVDHGLNIQAALEAPRVTKLSFDGCDVMVESRLPVEVRAALTRLGHEIDVRAPYSSMVGGGQAVMRTGTTGVNRGASDPRKDGAALPEPLPLR